MLFHTCRLQRNLRDTWVLLCILRKSKILWQSCLFHLGIFLWLIFDVPLLHQCVGIWFFFPNVPVKTVCLFPVELHGFGSWTTITSCTAVSSAAFCPISTPRASSITFICFLFFCDSVILVATVWGCVLRGCSVDLSKNLLLFGPKSSVIYVF